MTGYKQLYIFVEGPDDQRFIDSFVKPRFMGKYDNVKVILYACEVPSKITTLISVIRNQSSSEYIYLCDMDARGDKSICITNRKKKESMKYGNKLDIDKIIVVKEEIESWYLSGIDEKNLTKFKIKQYSDTEGVTKEDFRNLIPKKQFDSVSDFMIEILKDFSMENATSTNMSFNYFVKKYIQ